MVVNGKTENGTRKESREITEKKGKGREETGQISLWVVCRQCLRKIIYFP
jgi:hypothetical protein